MANTILQIGHVRGTGTNRRQIPVDTSSSLVWHRYQRLTVVTSGITLITTCQGSGLGTSRKMNTTSGQNTTVVLENTFPAQEDKSGVSSPAVTIDAWNASGTCSGAPTSNSTFGWVFDNNGAPGGWLLQIKAIDIFGDALLFSASSTSWCFPQTLNNDFELADTGFTVFGYNGTATISLSNSCP